MFTDSTQHRTETAQQTASVVGRAVEQLRHFVCGLHGHDALLHFGHGRLSLQCTSCGYETPGWEVGADAQPPAEKPRMVQMPLVGHRRAA